MAEPPLTSELTTLETIGAEEERTTIARARLPLVRAGYVEEGQPNLVRSS